MWRSVAPGLEFVVLPDAGPATEAAAEHIDIAVFSADLWLEGRAAPFMRTLLAAPHATWLHMFSAGLDDPVFARLAERGLTITHSAGTSATPIAHTVLMNVIALCRGGRHWQVAQSERRWANGPTADVEGRRMAIVGLGAIGSEVARIAQHFGIEVIGLRRTPTGGETCTTWSIDRLHDVLPTIDDLVLTAPLTDETRGIIGAAELALLPQGAHVHNVGRGELLDEAALIDALQRGHLGGAALDVFAVEPLPSHSPLWDMPNVIVTPHSAGTTPLAAQRAAEVFTRNLRHLSLGEPLTNVGFGSTVPPLRRK